MRILDVSKMRLELEYRPQQWIIGLGMVCVVLAIALLKALFGGEFGGAGIASVMLAAIGWLWLTRIFQTVRLTADRDAGTLRITTVSLFGEKFRERDLTDLTGAEVETRFDESLSSAKPSLVLQFGSERDRMNLFKPDPADLLQAAESINAWLAQSSTTSLQPGDPQA
jgi:hypothetical protein